MTNMSLHILTNHKASSFKLLWETIKQQTCNFITKPMCC